MRSVDLMRIVIAGAGSIGTVMGCMLQDVTLIRRNGPMGDQVVTVTGEVERSVDVQISRELPPADIIFFTVQEQHLKAYLQSLPDLPADTILVSVQNGITAPAEIMERYPSNPVLASSVWWSATLLDPLRVLYHRRADMVLGIPEGSTATQRQLELVIDLLEELSPRSVDNMGRELRTKLILNVVSPVLALARLGYPHGLAHPAVCDMVHALFDEALETAALLEWDVDPEDPRLLGFHRRLITADFEHGSSDHLVSTQLGMDKYGGEGSNVLNLLGWLQLSGSLLADEVIHLVLSMKPGYEAVTMEELQSILQMYSFARCQLKLDENSQE